MSKRLRDTLQTVVSKVFTREGKQTGVNLVGVGVAVAFLYWNAETLIHVFVFRDGGLLSQFFPSDRNELWMRGLVCTLFIAFGMYSQTVTKMRDDVKQQWVQGGQSKPQRTMTYVGILAAVLFWIVEAFVHTALFNEGQISQTILPTDVNEIWMRTLISLMLIVIGLYADSSMMKLRQSEAERLRLQKELETSLTKLLSGFIPICANCKDIREESGTWVGIEAYIENHSDIRFSHGICQKCAGMLYPEYQYRR